MQRSGLCFPGDTVLCPGNYRIHRRAQAGRDRMRFALSSTGLGEKAWRLSRSRGNSLEAVCNGPDDKSWQLNPQR